MSSFQAHGLITAASTLCLERWQPQLTNTHVAAAGNVSASVPPPVCGCFLFVLLSLC